MVDSSIIGKKFINKKTRETAVIIGLTSTCVKLYKKAVLPEERGLFFIPDEMFREEWEPDFDMLQEFNKLDRMLNNG